MNELLKEALRKIEKLSADEQDAVAISMLELLEHHGSVRLTDEQIAEVQRRREDPNQILLSLEEAMKQIDEFVARK